MSPPPALIDRARALVEAHLPAPGLTVDTLAAALGVDRTTLYRHLRAAGTTPSALIREARLRRAAALLAEGAPVGEAALAAGFEEVAAFSRAFRRHFGSAPSEWARAGGPNAS